MVRLNSAPSTEHAEFASFLLSSTLRLHEVPAGSPDTQLGSTKPGSSSTLRMDIEWWPSRNRARAPEEKLGRDLDNHRMNARNAIGSSTTRAY